MKVEIWSDIACPWCYIGKRRFESALEQFPESGNIDIEWKSFQLAPDLKTDPMSNNLKYLSDKYGVSMDQARDMTDRVSHIAATEGLEYDLDNSKKANTFNAHRMIHFAKKSGKQGEAKERLLKAYFIEGKNVDDVDTLISLGEEIGLAAKELSKILESSGLFSEEVKSDIAEARQLGIGGVPYFVIDRKYGISGAQEQDIFLQTLKKAYGEWVKENGPFALETIQGKSCTPDGDCNI
ncbi:DsbA family oxidoreductase [Membranihabitans maritimus]|uniref:DsbA family oxidoreductase n=1 Tax=Membranihabitans maritimus TaxID=2904244 RepID=UPI001F39423B|nr:DsbA family oxidoreductase [Membranihabitans maritimus]